jgi:hypothetical protein
VTPCELGVVEGSMVLCMTVALGNSLDAVDKGEVERREHEI